MFDNDFKHLKLSWPLVSVLVAEDAKERLLKRHDVIHSLRIILFQAAPSTCIPVQLAVVLGAQTCGPTKTPYPPGSPT